MLQRVIHIRNVGRFRNCAAVGDVTFRRSGPIFRAERFEESGVFLDNDGIGLEVG